MSFLDTVMSDTVGVGYRAVTGNVDPWSKQEIIDQATADQIKAGADPATAAANAQADVDATLQDFTLGGDDKVGADPSQSSGLNVPSFQAIKDTVKSATNDNGSGCGITNLGGCFQIPTWAYWAAGGVAVLGVLYVLGPYVGLFARSRQ